MFCRNCGQSINDNDNFCPYCGTKRIIVAAPVQPPKVEAPVEEKIETAVETAETVAAPVVTETEESIAAPEVTEAAAEKPAAPAETNIESEPEAPAEEVYTPTPEPVKEEYIPTPVPAVEHIPTPAADEHSPAPEAAAKKKSLKPLIIAAAAAVAVIIVAVVLIFALDLGGKKPAKDPEASATPTASVSPSTRPIAPGTIVTPTPTAVPIDPTPTPEDLPAVESTPTPTPTPTPAVTEAPTDAPAVSPAVEVDPEVYTDYILYISQAAFEYGFYNTNGGFLPSGLLAADLLDMDQDGTEELVCLYCLDNMYFVEIFTSRGEGIEYLYSTACGNGYGHTDVYVPFGLGYDYHGKPYLTYEYSFDLSEELFGVLSMENGVVTDTMLNATYNVDWETMTATIDTCYINGFAVSSEVYTKQRDDYKENSDTIDLAYGLFSKEEAMGFISRIAEKSSLPEDYIDQMLASLENPYYKQLVDVTVYEDHYAILRLFQWDGSQWQELHGCEAAIGKNGLTYDKTEGDGCTPAGFYEIDFAFSAHDYPTALESIQLVDGHVWVDDPDSFYYNRIVSANTVTKSWDSAEDLWSQCNSSVFAGIGFNFNGDSISGENIEKGGGSAIFLSGRMDQPRWETGTYGDIDIDAGSMEVLLSVLDQSMNPAIYIHYDVY